MTFLENAYEVGRTLGVLYTTQIHAGRDPDTIGNDLAADIDRLLPRELWSPPAIEAVQRGFNHEFTLMALPLLRTILETLPKIN